MLINYPEIESSIIIADLILVNMIYYSHSIESSSIPYTHSILLYLLILSDLHIIIQIDFLISAIILIMNLNIY